MLEIQARRNLMPGHAFAPDRPWQRDFENSFPYHETADQRRVIGEVKKEMEQPKPMDRLVCGDAGYGKTEVAMRAAFKAVMDERQVAVLVPTTVLAQQHFETFTRRMSPFPVRVEMLSRFRSRAQRHGVLRGLAEGAVDVVIGTHSLIQPDIRFRNLGLLIIDEEQRFGVAHKEMLKRAETLVDILTLTATPIPRTLYLSMTGARDMSLLQTPPGERMAIETIVDRNTDAVLREAILRELNREGQAYYLHNRVMTIARAAERVRRVVPEARVEFAHGQMASGDLATAMRRFAAGEFDVLVCTTIVESGTDIPRANTILIDRADRFGVADLYQLRGRVGRSNRKAYAYLLLPPHGPVDPAARKRIGAVERHSGLSAGFGLALRDLEIRGAGNLLGPEQSGHIAAVGFGLYCQMLRQAIARLKGEPPPPVADAEILLDFVALSPAGGPADKIAAVPHDYVEDERLRIAAYRRIAECGTPGDVEAVRAELRDRYGPLPPSAERLLRIAGLRILCAGKGVRRLETRGGRVVLTRGADYLMRDGRFPRLAAGTADGRIAELAALVAGLPPA
jgi:transcription-repair coupling factor (superfamily II helicase)